MQVIQSWYVMGRLGAFNSSNLQVCWLYGAVTYVPLRIVFNHMTPWKLHICLASILFVLLLISMFEWIEFPEIMFVLCVVFYRWEKFCLRQTFCKSKKESIPLFKAKALGKGFENLSIWSVSWFILPVKFGEYKLFPPNSTSSYLGEYMPNYFCFIGSFRSNFLFLLLLLCSTFCFISLFSSVFVLFAEHF